MEFLSLSSRRSSARNVHSDEERGERDVFAGYRQPDRVTLNQKNGLRAETKYVPITADRKVNEGLAALVHEASESNGYPFNYDGHTDLLKY